MAKLRDARFRKTNFASNGEASFNFDADTLKILMAVDESKTVLQLLKETRIDPTDFKDRLLRLLKLKLIEEAKIEISYVNGSFLTNLTDTLVNLVGPLGQMLIEATAEKMNFQASKIPKDNVADFIYEIAKEIPGEKQQAEFKKVMIQEINKIK